MLLWILGIIYTGTTFFNLTFWQWWLWRVLELMACQINFNTEVLVRNMSTKGTYTALPGQSEKSKKRHSMIILHSQCIDSIILRNTNVRVIYETEKAVEFWISKWTLLRIWCNCEICVAFVTLRTNFSLKYFIIHHSWSFSKLNWCCKTISLK
jgi:hypothetical protein